MPDYNCEYPRRNKKQQHQKIWRPTTPTANEISVKISVDL